MRTVVKYNAPCWIPYKGLYVELHQRCCALSAQKQITMPTAYQNLMHLLTDQHIYWPTMNINITRWTQQIRNAKKSTFVYHRFTQYDAIDHQDLQQAHKRKIQELVESEVPALKSVLAGRLNPRELVSQLQTEKYQSQVVKGLIAFLEVQFGDLESAISLLLKHRPDIIDSILLHNDDVLTKLTPIIVNKLKYTSQEIVDFQDEQNISNEPIRYLKRLRPGLWPTEEANTREKQEQNNKALPVESSVCSVGTENIKYSATDLLQKLDGVVRALAQKKLLTNVDNKIRVKISGDGFKRSVKNGDVSFSFVILDTQEVHSNLASWDVLIAECNEDAKHLHAVSKPLLERIASILDNNSVQLNNKDIIVDLYLVADQKFLMLLLGLGGPKFTFFCSWCECSVEDKGNFHKHLVTWSPDLRDSDINGYILRSVERNNHIIASMPADAAARTEWTRTLGKGFTHDCFIPKLSYSKIIPDVLHLLIRITEKLLQVTAQEYYNDKRKQTLEEQAVFLNNIRNALHNRSFAFSQYEKSNTLIRPSFDGKSCAALLKNSHIFLHQRGTESSAQFQERKKLWSDLWKIHVGLHKRVLSTTEQPILSKLISDWSHAYVARFSAHSVTNSIHVLYYHVTPYLITYGSLAPFSQQGIEMAVGTKKKAIYRHINPTANIPRELMLNNNRHLARLDRILPDTPKKKQCPSCLGMGHQRSTNLACPNNKHNKVE